MQQLTIKSFNIILLLLVLTGIAQSNEETLAFADQNTVYVSSLNDIADNDDEPTTDLVFTQQHHHVVEPSTATRCDSHHVFKTHTGQTKPIRAPPSFLQS